MKNIFRMVPRLLFLFSIVVGALSGGCGGGGGSAGFVSKPVTISSTNAPKVAANSALISGAMNGTSSAGGGVSAASVSPATQGMRMNAINAIIEHQIMRVGGVLGSGQTSHALAAPQILSGTPCTGGSGTYLVETLSSTSVSITYTDCVDSTTSGTANGTLLFSSLSIPNATSASGQISTSDFSVNDGQHVYALNGSAHFTDSMPSTTDTFTMSGGPLVINIDGAKNTLSGFTMSLVEDQNTLAYTTSLDGSLDSDALGGHVTIDTTTAFQGVNIDQNDPESGIMVVRGDSNSRVTVTATGSGSVRLDVIDGAGVSTSSNTTWSALEQVSL